MMFKFTYYYCCYVRVQLKKGESVELSQHGIDFLTDVFERFDRNKDGFLDISELKQLFLTAPADPFHLQSQDLVEGDPNRGISLKGFIALWRYFSILSYLIMKAYL